MGCVPCTHIRMPLSLSFSATHGIGTILFLFTCLLLARSRSSHLRRTRVVTAVSKSLSFFRPLFLNPSTLKA
ncbi:hypothetical protein BJV78DRAFT_1244387 [Lactifluus subvellereus]|nr:hypothetical protein BJV78DRAFT_1244387 [Lactifluus subvellereus]